jgi:hypothetical protein
MNTTTINPTPMHIGLPADPDGQNEDRAAWAAAALRAMMRETGCDENEALGDLLTNLRHWCDRNGQDFAAAVLDSERVYAEETHVDRDEQIEAAKEAGYSVHGPADEACNGWAYAIDGDYSPEYASEAAAWGAALTDLANTKANAA